MQKPMRVMLVTRSLMMGGTQRHIVKLCRALAQENVSISVCLLIGDEPRDLEHELPEQTKLYTCPYKRHDLRTVFWLASIVRTEKSQLVHSFSWHADFYSSLLKFLIRGLVVIGSERGDRGTQSFYKPAYNWIDRSVVFHLVDRVCANSHFGKQLLIESGCSPRKISVIPNGIILPMIDSEPMASVRELLDWPPLSTVCCIVSRLVSYKGLDKFINLVKFCDPMTRFVVIGEGPEKRCLLEQINSNALNERVILVGQIDPAIPYIKNADVCILPTISESEHCSNSILEYMACGKPVIAMDVSGNPELINPEISGFLVEPSEMEKMAFYINLLAANKDLAMQMGLAGRKRIEESFNMISIANRFHSLWQESLTKVL